MLASQYQVRWCSGLTFGRKGGSNPPLAIQIYVFHDFTKSLQENARTVLFKGHSRFPHPSFPKIPSVSSVSNDHTVRGTLNPKLPSFLALQYMTGVCLYTTTSLTADLACSSWFLMITTHIFILHDIDEN